MKEKERPYSLALQDNRAVFRAGMRDGVPIALGYLAVSFSLGLAARNAGLTPFQSFLTSLLCNASAGEYAGFSLIAAKASLLEVALMTFIANARYLLMSCAVSQRTSPKASLSHRMLMAYDLADEIFAISVARPGELNPNYTYGAVLMAAPCWALGTALGCLAGDLMPPRLVSALGVALFGMFLAVIIPGAKKSRVLAGLIAACFALSYLAAHLPEPWAMPEGSRTILLTVTISALAALLFPHEEEEEGER